MSVIFMGSDAGRLRREAQSPLRQRVDLRVGREAAERLLGEPEQAVDEYLEHAAAGADEFDIGLAKLLQSCPRTEGFGLVASTAAVVDDDLHGALLIGRP
jgi:hypothetical protein